MGIFRSAILTKQILCHSIMSANKASLAPGDVPKGFLAVYSGENQKKRCLVPVSYLSQSSFQALLIKAEEEFGPDHPMGCLTIPCNKETFLDVISHL